MTVSFQGVVRRGTGRVAGVAFLDLVRRAETTLPASRGLQGGLPLHGAFCTQLID